MAPVRSSLSPARCTGQCTSTAKIGKYEVDINLVDIMKLLCEELSTQGESVVSVGAGAGEGAAAPN